MCISGCATWPWVCVKQYLEAFVREGKVSIYISWWSNFNSTITNLLWRMTSKKYWISFVQIIKQSKHSIYIGGIQEMWGQETGSQKGPGMAFIHFWPIIQTTCYFSDLKHVANTYPEKWAISLPHLRFSFLTTWFTNQKNGNLKFNPFPVIQEFPSSGLLGDAHCWHLSWFSFNLIEHFNYRTQASNIFNSCP